MPFGLTNAGESFCRLMEMCIGDQQYVTFYSIWMTTIDQMIDRIELVFKRLMDFNLKIKPKKSFFFQSSVIFLGHVLSAKGITPNPEKVAKVKDWPTPKTAKEVHSFIGLASYYRRFIDNFAKKAAPLHALIGPIATKKKAHGGHQTNTTQLPPFEWKEEHEQAFRSLKDALVTAPVLGYYETISYGTVCTLLNQ